MVPTMPNMTQNVLSGATSYAPSNMSTGAFFSAPESAPYLRNTGLSGGVNVGASPQVLLIAAAAFVAAVFIFKKVK